MLSFEERYFHNPTPFPTLRTSRSSHNFCQVILKTTQMSWYSRYTSALALIKRAEVTSGAGVRLVDWLLLTRRFCMTHFVRWCNTSATLTAWMLAMDTERMSPAGSVAAVWRVSSRWRGTNLASTCLAIARLCMVHTRTGREPIRGRYRCLPRR